MEGKWFVIWNVCTFTDEIIYNWYDQIYIIQLIYI